MDDEHDRAGAVVSLDGRRNRVVDPRDARGRIVQLTRRGTAFLAEGNAVKRQIEARYAERIGRARLDALNRALDDLAEE